MITLLSDYINNLSTFVVNNNVLTFMMGTMIGFGATNVIKSFKTNIIDFFMEKYIGVKTDSNISLFFTSIFEFMFILFVLYLLYTKVFNKMIEKNQLSKKKEQEWRDEVIITLNKIANK